MDAKLHDEQGRIAALRRYEVLDTPREAPFERVANLVRTVLNVPISTVSLIDTDRQWYKSCLGMESRELPREETFCTHTIRAREPLIVPDTLLDDRFAELAIVKGEPFIRSYAGVPLASPDGYNLGSLCAIDRQPREFSPAQIEVMKSFAALVVDELELRRIAQIDSLTEAATRRSFLLELEKAISNFNRSGRPATLLVMDVDHFKRVNDTFGHAAGDDVLRKTCTKISSLLRKADCIGRLGGEEFGILLNEAEADLAWKIAERLRQTVEELTFSGVDSQVTASFGLAALDADLLQPDVWLARADEALYAAKHSGRNRVCVAESKAVAARTVPKGETSAELVPAS
ncbi:sensor domain-containing diguanylate cyclase [Terriglobus sp.]|uniref:sensor domain-containing diguanylate cyclase n=1 Tax=Terriglobus sp. TaxID=1889013 RepID=UPI003B00227B